MVADAMRLPRMTTRRWMIAVAVVGLVLTGLDLERRRSRYRGLAAHYRTLVAGVQEIEGGPLAGKMFRNPPGKSYAVVESRDLVQFRRTMAAKYERAARYPWLPVPPDPPPPE